MDPRLREDDELKADAMLRFCHLREGDELKADAMPRFCHLREGDELKADADASAPEAKRRATREPSLVTIRLACYHSGP